MESRKWYDEPICRQQWRCRHREQTCGHSRGRRGWDELREWHGNIYITVCKINSGNLLYNAGISNPVLCGNLEGWDGVGDGREA